jgi:hypothetical protein
MTRFLLAAVLVIVCFTVRGETRESATASQSPVSKASATVELVPEEPQAIVRITNHSNAALEAWRIVLTYELTAGSPMKLDHMTETVFDEAPRGTPGRGPLQPAETRDLRVLLTGVAVSASVELQMVLLSDSSSEGDTEPVLAQRARYARTLATWLKALDSVAGQPTEQAKAALQEILAAEKRREKSPDSLAVGTHMTIAELLQLDDSAQFADRIAILKRRFTLQRQRALSHRVR